MNRPIRITPLGVVLLAVAAGACAGEPTAPPAGGPTAGTDEIPVDMDLALQVAADEVVADVMVEDVALSLADNPSAGPWAEARELFRRARRAWRSGDTETAAELAMQGRLVLAEALIERRGEAGLDALRERLEAVVERLEEGANDYARLDDLRERLAELLDEAGTLRSEGDLAGAAERLLLGLGITDRLWHRAHDARHDAETHATRAVRSAAAVLQRVDGAIGADAGLRVEHALSHATELVRRAHAAVDRGAWRRAIVLSRRSIGWSLRAWRVYSI